MISDDFLSDLSVLDCESNSKVVHVDYAPREWQKECHLLSSRFLVLALHRRAGKTELAIMELIDKAITFKLELGLFVYVAPFLRQAKAIAWMRLLQKLGSCIENGIVTYNQSELSITFVHNGACIKVFGADNFDAIRGQRLDGAVIDEVAQIKPAVWVDVIQPCLSDRLGWAIFIGTVGGIDLFSELFFRAVELKDWGNARYTVYDTQSLDEDEVERLRLEMPEKSFAREYLCDFNAGSVDQVISMTDTELACKRIYREQDIISSPRMLGVDPARFGDDRSVIFKRQGLQAFDPIVYNKIDNMALAAKVAYVIEDWNPDAVCIDSGAGAGVIDRLIQLGFSVFEVSFGGKAFKESLFVNRRTEMWMTMKEWVELNGAIPNDSRLKQELSTPTYKFDSNGKMVLEKKEDIKKRLQGAGSPDLADALALTFAVSVQKKTIKDTMFSKNSYKDDYDLYDNPRF